VPIDLKDEEANIFTASNNHNPNIAIDWIHNLIYFDYKSNIHVMNISNKRMRAIIAYNETFTDIVVNPLESFLVWGTEIPNPGIIKANQDGSDRKVLVDNNIKSPSSIVIEFETKRIYFADDILKQITSLDFYGNNTRLINPKGNKIDIIGRFVEVYDRNIFFYNNLTNAKYDIKIINADGLSKGEIDIGPFPGSYSLSNVMKIIHSSRQPTGKYKCNHLNCTHLCLPTEHDFKCVCPSDQYLLYGEKCQIVSYILNKD
jgi:hypothetical protein